MITIYVYAYILSFTAAYNFSFANNTPEQCTISKKQITAGNASFYPSNDQIISQQGGKKSLQVKLVLKVVSYIGMYINIIISSITR